MRKFETSENKFLDLHRPLGEGVCSKVKLAKADDEETLTIVKIFKLNCLDQ